MLRRRAAEAARQGLRALLHDSSRAGSSATASAACSEAVGGGSAAALARWRHSLPAARAGARRPPAAPAASRQQVRWQWGDGRGYQHFQGRGRPLSAAAYSPDARRRATVLAAVLGGGGALVWVTSRQEVPYTKRMHAILISPESEAELGQQTFEQVLGEAKSARRLLPPSSRAARAVARVGGRIAQTAADGYGGGYQAHLRGLAWQFAVIDSPEVNAFVVPGGKVVVYTGLLRMVASDDELAAVLAHESAHVVARHAAERITQMGALEVLRAAAYILFGLPIPSGLLSGIFFLPNSRKAETEADAIGLQIMSRACYDPTAMESMFAKMAAAEKRDGGDRVPKFLRTHPHSSDRIKAIRKMMPQAEGLREMSGCETARGALPQYLRAAVAGGEWQ